MAADEVALVEEVAIQRTRHSVDLNSVHEPCCDDRRRILIHVEPTDGLTPNLVALSDLIRAHLNPTEARRRIDDGHRARHHGRALALSIVRDGLNSNNIVLTEVFAS